MIYCLASTKTPLIFVMLPSLFLAGVVSAFVTDAAVGADALIPPHQAFSIFDSNTAWQPGEDTARAGGHGWPGGASFSIMDGGYGAAGDLFELHGNYLTQPITSLGVPGYAYDNYVADIDWALDRWAAVSGFTNLGHVDDGDVAAGASSQEGGNLGDIRIAAWEFLPDATIASAFVPDTEGLSAVDGTLGGDIHFDVSRDWIDNPNHQRPPGNSQFDFRTVVLHEIGHALGVAHSSVAGSVMNTSYNGTRRELTADDIAGIQALYGEPPPIVISPIVGRWDIANLVRSYSESTSEGLAEGDWNADGIVTLADLATLQAQLGELRPDLGSSPQAVPEPGSLTLLWLAITIFASSRRRCIFSI